MRQQALRLGGGFRPLTAEEDRCFACNAHDFRNEECWRREAEEERANEPDVNEEDQEEADGMWHHECWGCWNEGDEYGQCQVCSRRLDAEAAEERAETFRKIAAGEKLLCFDGSENRELDLSWDAEDHRGAFVNGTQGAQAMCAALRGSTRIRSLRLHSKFQPRPQMRLFRRR